MESLYAYIPTDRRYALARGSDLPDRTTGAALFADISGFTPLTEALVQALGPQRGAEELTCWLDDHAPEYIKPFPRASSALRATACALSIQQTMQQFAQVDIFGVGMIS